MAVVAAAEGWVALGTRDPANAATEAQEGVAAARGAAERMAAAAAAAGI